MLFLGEYASTATFNFFLSLYTFEGGELSEATITDVIYEMVDGATSDAYVDTITLIEEETFYRIKVKCNSGASGYHCIYLKVIVGARQSNLFFYFKIT